MCSKYGWLPFQLTKISLSFSLPVHDWMPPKNGIMGGPSKATTLWSWSQQFFSMVFSGPYQLSLFLTVLLPTKNEMKVQKENRRFNAEAVVANYCFGTWNIGTLKGKSGEVCEVLRRRKVNVCCIQEMR